MYLSVCMCVCERVRAFFACTRHLTMGPIPPGIPGSPFAPEIP